MLLTAPKLSNNSHILSLKILAEKRKQREPTVTWALFLENGQELLHNAMRVKGSAYLMCPKLWAQSPVLYTKEKEMPA